MGNDLSTFLARHTIGQESEAHWGDGQIQLRVRAYLSSDVPPSPFVTSVRCLLFRDATVLVMRDAAGVHVLPGGRREAGETFEATVRRELLEETGWVPRDLAPLGYLHFHHISPRPDDYPYPYPDFIHMIYRAEAEAYEPEGRIADDHEEVVGFVPIVDALDMPDDVRGRWHLQQCISDP